MFCISKRHNIYFKQTLLTAKHPNHHHAYNKFIVIITTTIITSDVIISITIIILMTMIILIGLQLGRTLGRSPTHRLSGQQLNISQRFLHEA